MTIIEQLTEYCNCIEVNEKDVYELVNLISSYTGWMQDTCETFLLGERREVIELSNCKKGCEIFEFTPFYQPFDYDTFQFYLVEQNGIDEVVSELVDYRYSSVDENFKLDLPLPDCECSPACGCETKYKLLVTYEAGYELIPECLLPIFCDALEWIRKKNECCSDCQDCDTSYGNNQIDMDSLEGRLQEYFLSMLTRQYIRALSLIALNRRARHLWGIVV